ncbi:hypothetical protein IMSAGC016_01381 [Muribaculaceae bacterium]|nr:hypothetical protein IMSAGC016_01381 [Muribaculaceae bacterium]
MSVILLVVLYLASVTYTSPRITKASSLPEGETAMVVAPRSVKYFTRSPSYWSAMISTASFCGSLPGRIVYMSPSHENASVPLPAAERWRTGCLANLVSCFLLLPSAVASYTLRVPSSSLMKKKEFPSAFQTGLRSCPLNFVSWVNLPLS